jgi:hypothetical protein
MSGEMNYYNEEVPEFVNSFSGQSVSMLPVAIVRRNEHLWT